MNEKKRQQQQQHRKKMEIDTKLIEKLIRIEWKCLKAKE